MDGYLCDAHRCTTDCDIIKATERAIVAHEVLQRTLKGEKNSDTILHFCVEFVRLVPRAEQPHLRAKWLGVKLLSIRARHAAGKVAVIPILNVTSAETDAVGTAIENRCRRQCRTVPAPRPQSDGAYGQKHLLAEYVADVTKLHIASPREAVSLMVRELPLVRRKRRAPGTVCEAFPRSAAPR